MTGKIDLKRKKKTTGVIYSEQKNALASNRMLAMPPPPHTHTFSTQLDLPPPPLN